MGKAIPLPVSQVTLADLAREPVYPIADTGGRPELHSTSRKDPMDPLLTVKDAAQLLQCSEAAVRKWIYQRRLPFVKVGRLTRLRRLDVEALVAGGRSTGLGRVA